MVTHTGSGLDQVSHLAVKAQGSSNILRTLDGRGCLLASGVGVCGGLRHSDTTTVIWFDSHRAPDEWVIPQHATRAWLSPDERFLFLGEEHFQEEIGRPSSGVWL